MKPPSILLGLVLVVGEAAAASCNADNCARAVTGTRTPLASHSQDCQSFLSCTVTPVPSTVISTATVTAVVTSASAVAVTPAPFVTTVTTLAYPIKRQVTASPVTNCPSAVPTYASACSGASRYASACSCFGLSRTTTTLLPSTTTTATTITVTSTVLAPFTTTLAQATIATAFQPAKPSVCGNEGLQWAYYRDFSANDNQAYEPANIKNKIPEATGVTDYVHYGNPEGYENTEANVYGTDGLPAFNLALNHRGYIFAPETGSYKFEFYYVDDDAFLWIGPLAYSGWKKANANISTISPFFDTGFTTTYIDLVEGTYYPFRIEYWNSNQDDYGSMNFNLNAPSGRPLIFRDDNYPGAKNPYVIQYSCDGISAPPYPPFGAET